MQSTIKSLKSEQSRRSSSSNVDRRRQLTALRRANSYPYCRNKINSENCYKCSQNNDYINVLNARFAKIENLVENLSKAVKETTLTRKTISPSSSSTFGSINLSKMSIDELLCFSSQLGIRLFGNLEKNNSSAPIKIEPKESLPNHIQDVNSPSPAQKE